MRKCGNPRAGKLWHCVKEPNLSGRTLALRTRTSRDRVIKGKEDLRWVAEAPKRANLGQRFKDALVRKS